MMVNDYFGYPTRRLSSESLELECLVTAGPRIVRLRYKGGPNLLAEVPEIAVPTPYGDFRYLGGHRLWHAPETMPESYIPDGEGLTLTEMPNGLVLDGATEIATGIHKRIVVELDPHRSRVSLTHSLTNEGTAEVRLAPWALTMLRLGGTAILPIRAAGMPSDELLPNRHFSLWPYSRVHDPRLQLEDNYCLVTAQDDLPPFKIAALDPAGWTAYWLDGILFVKRFDPGLGWPHPDFDCNAEIYCDEHFIELESLGSLSLLAPGAAASLNEVWEILEVGADEFVPREIVETLADAPVRE